MYSKMLRVKYPLCVYTSQRGYCDVALNLIYQRESNTEMRNPWKGTQTCASKRNHERKRKLFNQND